MTTQKQIDANRCNATKSTGPRTAEGKAVSSRNATRHGVLSTKAVVSQYEDREVYEALREQLVAELEPASAVERSLVERLTNLLWRERRLAEAEASAITAHNVSADMEIVYGATPFRGLGFNEQLLVGRYQGMLSRQIRETVRELREEQELRMQVIEHDGPSARGDRERSMPDRSRGRTHLPVRQRKRSRA